MTVSGQAARVVLVHGAGGGAWQWRCWRPVFEARGWSVEAIELRPAPDGLAATRLADYRDQVLRHAAGCDLLIGASLGGLLALAAAPVIAPHGALVLLNALGPAEVLAAAPLPVGEFGAIEAWAGHPSVDSTRRAMPQSSTAALWYAHRRWRDESGAVLREAHAGVPFDPPARRCLVLQAEQDATVPPAHGRALARWCGATFWIIPAAGHLDPLFAPYARVWAQRVSAWVAGDVGQVVGLESNDERSMGGQR